MEGPNWDPLGKVFIVIEYMVLACIYITRRGTGRQTNGPRLYTLIINYKGRKEDPRAGNKYIHTSIFLYKAHLYPEGVNFSSSVETPDALQCIPYHMLFMIHFLGFPMFIILHSSFSSRFRHKVVSVSWPDDTLYYSFVSLYLSAFHATDILIPY
jgi:hypothetical protein